MQQAELVDIFDRRHSGKLGKAAEAFAFANVGGCSYLGNRDGLRIIFANEMQHSPHALLPQEFAAVLGNRSGLGQDGKQIAPNADQMLQQEQLIGGCLLYTSRCV